MCWEEINNVDWSVCVWLWYQNSATSWKLIKTNSKQFFQMLYTINDKKYKLHDILHSQHHFFFQIRISCHPKFTNLTTLITSYWISPWRVAYMGKLPITNITAMILWTVWYALDNHAPATSPHQGVRVIFTSLHVQHWGQVQNVSYYF